MSRDKIIAITVATIALINIVITQKKLDRIKGRKAAINSKLERLNTVTDRANNILYHAENDLNFIGLKMSLLELTVGNANWNSVKNSIGDDYVKSMMKTLAATYDENDEADVEEVKRITTEMVSIKEQYGDDAYRLIPACGKIKEEIEQRAQSKLKRDIDEKKNLSREKEELDKEETTVVYFSTTIQSLSILLVLLRDLFKQKDKAKAAA